MWRKIKYFFQNLFGRLRPEKRERIFITRQLSSYEESYLFMQLPYAKVAYLERGEKGNEKILFLHGMTESAMNWFYTMEYLLVKSNRFHLIAIDLPGFGKTEINIQKVSRLSEYIRLIKDFLDQKGWEKVTLVGHSLGGQTAGLFAYHFPERVNKLILVDSAGLRRFPGITSSLMKAMPIPGNLLKQVSLLDWVKILANSSFMKDEKYFRKMMYETAMVQKNTITEYFISKNHQKLIQDGVTRVQVIKNAMDAMLEKSSYIDEKIKELKMPICFIWGEKDLLVPLKYGITAYESIPHDKKKIYVFKKTGHYPPLERPRDFADIIYRFLTETEIEK